jgi:ketosteroid isomerase-like protein
VSTAATVTDAWAALSGGDIAAVEAVLAPDARWHAVEDGPWNCDSAREIVEALGHRLQQGLAGNIDSIEELGERAIVGFRPARHEPGAWPLDDGVRYVVLTFREGLIVEMKGCATRVDARGYARRPGPGSG